MSSSGKADDILPGQGSFYRARSKAEVIAEYTDAAHAPEAWQKAKWGSAESMLNRFRLGLSVIDWTAVHHWIDIGCGVADFFAMAEEEGRLFPQLTGLDITPAIIEQARTRTFRSPTRFFAADMVEAAQPPYSLGETADLVTLVGVLQQCGERPGEALQACADLLRPGGQLFLTTKNIHWTAFETPGFEPERNHSWFDFAEIESGLKTAGLQIRQQGGFLPRENIQVSLNDSHTMFVLAERKA